MLIVIGFSNFNRENKRVSLEKKHSALSNNKHNIKTETIVFHVTLDVLLKDALDFYLKWYPSPVAIHNHFFYTYPIRK